MSFRDCYRDDWNSAKLQVFIVAGKLERLFRRPPMPLNHDGKVNIHLGCGGINHPAFINIDGIPAPHVHYVQRIDKLHPFTNDSVDLVYACHCLEHFSHRQIANVLKEWHRIIKKGGILRVAVPDFDSMVKLYLATGCDIEQVLEPITGGQEYKFNFHMTIFNESFLSKLFLDVGFSHVQAWMPGSSDLTTFDDWSGRFITVDGIDFPISLNLEAIK